MSQGADMPPRHIAALKRQLQAANTRLLSLERERRQLKEALLRLRASLQRIEAGPRAPAARPRERADYAGKPAARRIKQRLSGPN